MKLYILFLSINIFFLTMAYSSNANDLLPHKCSTFHNVSDRKPTNELQAGRATMQTFAISPQNRFRVHYDTVGVNAVEKVDKNYNGIPDYIDTVCSVFDNVYEVEVNEMGFLRPPTDYYEAGDMLYDIYIEDLSMDMLYGKTETIDIFGNGVFPKYYSKITIDNNYSPTDSAVSNGRKIPAYPKTNGSDAVKVTAAHEYHHAIQFTYGEDASCRSIYEMNGVCMEMLVYPQIDDYLQYVNLLFTDISRFVFGNGWYENGYSYGIFFYMINQKYGIDAIRNFWETLSSGVTGYRALNRCLLNYSSTLNDEWFDFTKWIYHSGSRTIEGQYFPMAYKFNDLLPTSTAQFYQQYLRNDTLLPYELAYNRMTYPSDDFYITPDTSDFLITNLDSNGAAAQSFKAIVASTYIASSQEGNTIPVFDGKYWYSIYSANEMMDSIVYLYSGSAVHNVSKPYPQPLYRSDKAQLYLPVPDSAYIGQKVKLIVYNADLCEIAAANLPITVNNRNRVIVYPPSGLSSGVYIYSIDTGGSKILGKFLIK